MNNETCHETVWAWTDQYKNDDNCVFFESLCDAIIDVAQQEGRYQGDYNTTDLDRASVRTSFEESLRYGLTDPVIGYTTRDIALVNEYLRTGCATTTPDAALVQSKEMGQDATRKLQE